MLLPNMGRWCHRVPHLCAVLGCLRQRHRASFSAKSCVLSCSQTYEWCLLDIFFHLQTPPFKPRKRANNSWCTDFCLLNKQHTTSIRREKDLTITDRFPGSFEVKQRKEKWNAQVAVEWQQHKCGLLTFLKFAYLLFGSEIKRAEGRYEQCVVYCLGKPTLFHTSGARYWQKSHFVRLMQITGNFAAADTMSCDITRGVFIIFNLAARCIAVCVLC